MKFLKTVPNFCQPKHSDHDLPFTIRYNAGATPTSHIQLTARAETLVGGVLITYSRTTNGLRGRGGDGGNPDDLEPGKHVDFFLSDDLIEESLGRTGNQRFFFKLEPSTAYVIRIVWERINGEESAGELSIICTYPDWLLDKPPTLVVGAESEALEKHLKVNRERGRLLTFTPDRRVQRMNSRELARRTQAERDRRMDALYPGESAMATAITIKGFRGFRDETELKIAQPNGKDGSGLTFVVGANSTGKSTIWESFEAIARSLKSSVSFSEGRRNRGCPDGIRIRLSRSNHSVYTLESQSGNTSETKSAWSSGSDPAHKLDLVAVPSRRNFQASFGKFPNAERDWMFNGMEFTRYRQNDQFTGRLFDLNNDPSKKQEFDRLLSEVLGHEFNWTIDLAEGSNSQSSYYLKVTTGQGVSHSSEGVGDGIISLLYTLNALYDSVPNTLIVLDEPELSLHPQLVARLGNVLARLAKDRQIVVFTHSPQIVSWDAIEAGAEIARVHKEGAVSRISQPSRDVIKNALKSRGGFRNPHVLGFDANMALFLDDGIIVVEGQDDAALLPLVFELAGVPLTGTIFGWGSGGAGSAPKIVGLLKALGFQRVAVVLDNNVKDTVTAIQSKFADVLVEELPTADIRDKDESDARAPVVGLLDNKGRTLKEEFKQATFETLTRVTDFLSREERLTD